MFALLAVSLLELVLCNNQPAGSVLRVLPTKQRPAAGRTMEVLLCTDAASDHWETGVHQVPLNVHSQSDARKRSPSA